MERLFILVKLFLFLNLIYFHPIEHPVTAQIPHRLKVFCSIPPDVSFVQSIKLIYRGTVFMLHRRLPIAAIYPKKILDINFFLDNRIVIYEKGRRVYV